MKTLAHQNPSHMRPPFAVHWAVGIAFLIRELMVNAMRCYPENRATFEGQSSTRAQEVFNPLWSLIAAMGQQAVVAHANPEAAGNPPEHNRGEESFPGKEEKCRNCAYMEQPHKTGCDPVDLIVLTCALERFDL